MQTGTMLIIRYGLVPLNIIFEGAVKWILDHKIIGRHQRFRDETGNDDIGGERACSHHPHWPGRAHLETTGREMVW